MPTASRRAALPVLWFVIVLLAACAPVAPAPAAPQPSALPVVQSTAPTAVEPAPRTSTPDANAVPTMSPTTQAIFLREGFRRLDREMGEWMERVAGPRLDELRGALERSDFTAACQVTVVEVDSMLRGMTPPIAGLEALQPAHDAAAQTLTAWQELRKTTLAFCKAPGPEGRPGVLAGIEAVLVAFDQFRTELPPP